MDDAMRPIEDAIWASLEGGATAAQLALLEGDPAAHRRVLEHLIDDAEDRLDSVLRLDGPERDQVVADVEDELDRLEAAYDRLVPRAPPVSAEPPPGTVAEPAGEVRRQGSWAAGQVVVWAGPGAAPETIDQLADRHDAIGGPALGGPHLSTPRSA